MKALVHSVADIDKRKQIKIMAWICFWISISCIADTAAARDAPDWLCQAVSSDLPVYDKKVPYVVLYDELKISLNKKGHITRRRCAAIKFLQIEGRAQAFAKVVYKTDTDKVRDFYAWIFSPQGEVTEFNNDYIVDSALVDNNVYNDVRMKVIFAFDHAEEGAVFGYETVVEERSVFGQFEWYFQLKEPVLQSRLIVELPEDWTLEALTRNHPEINPDIVRGTYVWELHNLPHIDYEPLSPPIESIAPRLLVSMFPPPGKSSTIPSFRNWTDVSLWLSGLIDPKVVLSKAMKKKAEALTADIPSEFEKIAAIAGFCQSINYISIQTGVGRGGGYQPHSAKETFAKGYGDCKDKTNLMRALLKAIGIPAYPVSVYSWNRQSVREDWPSPQQFNHSIIAIKINKSIDAPAAIHHEHLGHLLIFDPTDNFTKLGDIPGNLQGSLGLLVAGEAGRLFRLPMSPPEANRTERNIDLELLPNGSIRARIFEELYGSTGSAARKEYGDIAPDDYKEMIEAWISNSVQRPNVSKVEFQPDVKNGIATLEVQFTAPRYGQLLQGGLILFNPNIVSRRNSIELTEPSRKLPIAIEPRSFIEMLRLRLPPGTVVDELPEPVNLKEAFGTYSAEYKTEEGILLYRRSLLMDYGILPADQYDAVRQFHISIRNSEQSPIVLREQ